MKIKRTLQTLLFISILIQSLVTLGGCSSVRQKYDDCKHYFLTEVARW